jgi:uncharacterized membrane protein
MYLFVAVNDLFTVFGFTLQIDLFSGELIDNFLRTTANQLTVYGYICILCFVYIFLSVAFSFITL